MTMPRGERRRFHERRVFDTRLDQFLHRNKVSVELLAAAIEMTRQYILRLRAGRSNARQDTITRLVLGLRNLLGRPVSASELFYLGEAQGDHSKDAHRFRCQYPLPNIDAEEHK